MRVKHIIAALVVLPACQMSLPSGQDAAPKVDPDTALVAPQGDDVEAQTLTAEGHLAAAFEQAALVANVEPVPAKKGLFGFLKPDKAPEVSVLAGTDIEVIDGSSAANKVAISVGGIVPDTDIPAAVDDVTVVNAVAPVQAGLGGAFGFLKRKPNNMPRTAALKAPEPDVTPKVAPKTKARKPLFGFLNSHSGQHTVSTVARGEVLPFGAVGITCEAQKRDMGEPVAQFPHDGSAAWQLFDTDPTSTAPRTQYITGFSDGCARQVTAAMILFGAPSLHEVHRYSKTRAEAPWSTADNRYEKIKASACGVGRAQPCPPAKLGTLEQDMAFVSVYKRFGDTAGWLELLLYDGDLKTEELR